jgi:predicted DNA-binding transcriptional regulator YafY
MTTSGRLLRLLSLLQTPRDWTGAELAGRLEVSQRTIRNDVDRLRALGYPVHATRGPIGGYRLEAGATLPPLLLEDDEAVAVAIGLRSATGGAVAGIEETSLRALAKLEQVLPPRLRARVNTLQTYTMHVRDTRSRAANTSVDSALLTELAAACRDRRGGPVGGRAPRGRAAHPRRVVNWGQRWDLVAWDVDRADWRTFRVDRVASGMSLGTRFTPRALTDADVEALVSRGVPHAARRFQARVVVHAGAAVLAERIGPNAGTVTAIDDGMCLLDTGADSLEMMAVYLGTLGVDFTVADPPELIDHVRTLANRYARAGGTGRTSASTGAS